MKHLLHQLKTGTAAKVTTLIITLMMTLPALADSNWYWHYAPVDGPGHGIGISHPEGDQVGTWQVRLNVGYEIDSLGLTVQRQEYILPSAPRWYLATGARISRHFQDEYLTTCSLMDCPNSIGSSDGEWAGSLFTRWSWGYSMTDARLDLGYGMQFRLRQQADTGKWAGSLGPTVDVILGFHL